MKKIIFTQQYTDRNTAGRKLLYHLSQNKNLDIEYDYSIPPVLTGDRRARLNFHTFIINETVFVLDDWDTLSPTSLLLHNNISKFYLDNPTTILKIQYCESEQNNYDKIFNQLGIKILPFIMFSNNGSNLESFAWDKNSKHSYTFCLTGKCWRNRSAWFKFSEQYKTELNCFVQYHSKGERSTVEENTIFMELLKNTKWGLILKGKGCGGKNRREVEFSSFGMPLVLNYKPIYPFSFIPNKDFLLIENYTDLFKLKDIDPEPFAQRSKEIYNNYFSPNNGLFNSFEIAYQTATNTQLPNNNKSKDSLKEQS